MDVTVSQAQGRVPVSVFRITGPVTDNQELEALAQQAYDSGARNILLDLTNVPYMATSGLRALHAIYTLLRSDSPEESDEATKAGIAAGTFLSPHLKLLKPTPHVLEVLKTSGYDMFLQIHRDLNSAIASF
ncbi:MAG TPA: STAS domain-containing protein [Roseiflexaceae bacterium]|nr:STAS domain-containing protein [Roseiflexaceae bacterium]